MKTDHPEILSCLPCLRAHKAEKRKQNKKHNICHKKPPYILGLLEYLECHAQFKLSSVIIMKHGNESNSFY